MKRRSRTGIFRKPAGQRVLAWTILAALLVNLIWPTTLVIASAASPSAAIFFAPVCTATASDAPDQGPTKAPGHAIHCPLCVVTGSQLAGPVTPIVFLVAPASSEAISSTSDLPGVLTGVEARPQQARAPPLSA